MKKIGTLLLGFSLVFLAACGSNNKNSNNTSNVSPSSETTKFDTSKTIKVYTRDTSSGTREGFFEKIDFKEAQKKNEVLVKGAIETSGNGDMIQHIKGDEYSIGYVSLSSLDGTYNGLTYEGVEPTEANVLNGTYALTRNFNYVIRAEYDNQDKENIVKAFVAYMQTQEGKATIKANSGIIDVKATDPKWDDIKSLYPVCLKDNSSITVKFGGSTSVEKIAKALSSEFASKCGNFVPEHNHTGSGDAWKYTQGSNKNDNAKLDIAFLSREIKQDTEPCAEKTSGRICIDAIVAATNKNNPLKEINAATLKDIYSGAKTKWNEIIL